MSTNKGRRWATSYNQALGEGTLNLASLALDPYALDQIEGYNRPGWFWHLKHLGKETKEACISIFLITVFYLVRLSGKALMSKLRDNDC